MSKVKDCSSAAVEINVMQLLTFTPDTSQSNSSDKFLQILAVPLHDLGDIDPDDGDNDNEQDDYDPELDCVE